jgi:hypothetical protein
MWLLLRRSKRGFGAKATGAFSRSKRARPNPLQKLLFFHNSTPVFNQNTKGLQSFRREADGLSLAAQERLAGIQLERAELIDASLLLQHMGFQTAI